MKKMAMAVLVVAGVWLGVARAQPPEDKDVTLHVSAFDGDGALGLQTATVLNLQIWNTLRRAPTPNPEQLDFGRGTIVWSPEPLATQSHEEAEEMAAAQGYEMALWGKAWRLGDEVAVQTYLSFPDDPERLLLWRTAIDVDDQHFEFTLPIPRRRYEFGTVVLSPSVVRRYSSPAGLTIHAEPSTDSSVLGEAGEQFRALEQGEAWAKVVSGEVVGWVKLDELADSRTQVVDFVSGMICAMRSDWQGALARLENVLSDPSIPISVRMDALLYLGLAKFKMGQDGLAELDEARQLSPHARMTALYSLMGRIERLSNLADAARRPAVVGEMRQIIEQRRYVFPPDDPWLGKAESLIAALER